MRSSVIISLFGRQCPPKRGPSAVVVSVAVHTCAFVLLFLGWHQPHTADIADVAKRYTVRMMELHQPEPKIQRYVPKEPAAPGQTAKMSAVPGNSPLSAPAPRVPANLVAQKQVVETLVQPDVTNNLLIPKEVPLPQVGRVEFAGYDGEDDRSDFTADGHQDRGAAFAGGAQSGCSCVGVEDCALGRRRRRLHCRRRARRRRSRPRELSLRREFRRLRRRRLVRHLRRASFRCRMFR